MGHLYDTRVILNSDVQWSGDYFTGVIAWHGVCILKRSERDTTMNAIALITLVYILPVLVAQALHTYRAPTTR